MRVVALCDSLGAAVRMWRGLAGAPDIDLHCLVSGEGFLRRLRRASAADWRMAARLAFTRRLHLTSRGLDHRSTVACVKRLKPEIGLLDGATIVRAPLLACFQRGVLCTHAGLLPEYGGRAGMEWPLLEGHPTGVTVRFLDSSIGTGGEIVLRREIPHGAADVAGARRALQERDPEFFREALARLQEAGYRPLENRGRGRRFYAMSRLFTGVVEAVMERGAPDRVGAAGRKAAPDATRVESNGGRKRAARVSRG